MKGPSDEAWGSTAGRGGRAEYRKYHTRQRLRLGLHTLAILGGNSHLSWFYDKGFITDPAHTGTSKRVPQAINRGPIRKSLPNSAYVYVAIQSHGLSPGAWTVYVKLSGPSDP